MRWKLRWLAGSWPRVANSMNDDRTTWMNTYAMANSNPSWPNAFGIAADIMRPANISRNISARTEGLSGSIQLVNQAVYIHTHQTASSRNAVLNAPSRVRCSSSVCDSCVTANTNTRSKNNSTKVTRACESRERSRLVREVLWAACVMARSLTDSRLIEPTAAIRLRPCSRDVDLYKDWAPARS